MQKSKNAQKAREIYEGMVGRVSDAKWSRLHRACNFAGVPMDYQSIKILVELGKISSHLVHTVLALKSQQPDPCPVDALTTGSAILKMIKAMGIRPNRSTVYRWFYRLRTEFKATNHYDASITALVMLQAQIYQHKQRSIKHGTNRVQ